MEASARALVAEAGKRGVEAGRERMLEAIAEAFRPFAGGKAGKGHHKNEEWRIHDQARELLERLRGYRRYLRMIGEGRQSCSRTDPDARSCV